MNINSYGDVAKLNIATSPYDIPKRKSVASVHATLFLFGMSLRGFSSLHCSFVYIYKAGECSFKKRKYIVIGVHRRKAILGGNDRQQHNCNNNLNSH